MRKKAHIKLASILFEALGDEEFNRYKFWYKVGSILPDVVPTFIWKRHRIDTTHNEFCKSLTKLMDGNKCGRLCCVRAGVLTHYLSDYFTYPHNKECLISLMEHNSYEYRQLTEIKLLTVSDIRELPVFSHNIQTKEDVLKFIELLHEEYLRRVVEFVDSITVDLTYIAYVNYMIMQRLFSNEELLSTHIIGTN